MKKKKENNSIKTVVVSGVSIGLVCALFVGVNSLVFASEKSKTENIKAVTSAADNIAKKEETASTDFKKPSLSVSELDVGIPESAKNKNAMSAEEAAQIGAEHLWEIFGESIDGKFVSMFYEVSSLTNRSYWTAFVTDEQPDNTDEIAPVFGFMVDAVSGEKKNAQRIVQEGTFREEEEKAIKPYLNDDEKRFEILKEYEKKRKENAKKLYQEASEEFAQIAKDTAQKHFKNSIVSKVEYLEDRSNDGIVFAVTDDTGHKIEIAIFSDTKQVEFVDDRVDEIDPSFVPDPDAVG